MTKSIEYIFAKPVNTSYHEFGINSIDRMKWINRDDLRHFISNNIDRDLISIAEIKKLVEGYAPFIIDNVKREFYVLDLEYSKHDITNIVNSKELYAKELSGFDKVRNKVKNFTLKLD